MVVFLANRANLQSKRLHDHIQNRLAVRSKAFDSDVLSRVKPAHTGSSLR